MTDFDGLSSAALLVKYLNVPLENVTFGGPSLQDIKGPMQGLLSRRIRNSLLIFTDLAVDHRAADCVKRSLSALKRRGNRIVWIDHHPIDASQARFLRKECALSVCGESRSCAAELVIRELDADDRYSRRIGRIAHLMDFNLELSRHEQAWIRAIARAIAMVMLREGKEAKLRRIVRLVSKGELRSEYIRSLNSSYMRLSKSRVSNLRKNCRLYEVKGHPVGIGYGRSLQSTQACDVIRKKLNTDMEVYINTDHSFLNLRSRNGVDCSAVAKALGGGGHVQASGAHLKRQLKGKRDIDACINSILKESAKVL